MARRKRRPTPTVDQPLTKQDVQQLLDDAGLSEWPKADPAGFAAFWDYIYMAQGFILKEMQETMAAEYYDVLRKPVSPAAAAKARALAHKQAMRITGQLTATELNKIGDTIAFGLEEGWHPTRTARFLADVKALDVNRARTYAKLEAYYEASDMTTEQIEKALERDYGRLLRKRRDTIAITESNDAVSTAREIEAQDRGAKGKAWIDSGDARVRPEHAANSDQGVIPVNQAFSNGLMRPGEPSCRCTVAYYTHAKAIAVANDSAKQRSEIRAMAQRQAEVDTAAEKLREAA